MEEVEEVEEEEEVDKLFGKVAPSTLLLPRERMPPLMELRWAPLLPFKAVDVPVCRGTGDNRFMVRSVVRKQLKKNQTVCLCAVLEKSDSPPLDSFKTIGHPQNNPPKKL